MSKELISKSITYAVMFGIIFFIFNYFAQEHHDLKSLTLRTILALISFFVLYIILFSVFNSDERKIKYGTTLTISIFICLIIGALIQHIRTGLIIGIILGLLGGFIWERLSKS